MLFGLPNLLSYIYPIKLKKMEIVERSSGYWIIEDKDIDGPFSDLKEAQEVLENYLHMRRQDG